MGDLSRAAGGARGLDEKWSLTQRTRRQLQLEIFCAPSRVPRSSRLARMHTRPAGTRGCCRLPPLKTALNNRSGGLRQAEFLAQATYTAESELVVNGNAASTPVPTPCPAASD